MEEKLKNKRRKNRKKFLIVTIFIVILVIIGIIVYAKVKEDNCTNNYNQLNGIFYNDLKYPSMVDKPIIYLYPIEETKVSVNLEYSNKLTCSYPKYINGWNVLAKTNGDLVDLDSKKNLYSLYYESTNVVNFYIKEDGFVIKGADVVGFLEEKLAILGLSEREVEEFIIYWLPKLQNNTYNYIRFATQEEINTNMPLKINPNPDTIIRVLMTFKGLENYIDVREQKLETPSREGFVVVEWGGTEIK